MRTRTRLVGLLATLILLGIVIGLPAILLALGANPIPRSLPTLEQLRSAVTTPDDGTLALGAIKVIAWASWIILTGSILLEITARLRCLPAPRVPGLSVPQGAAHRLVTAAAPGIRSHTSGPIDHRRPCPHHLHDACSRASSNGHEADLHRPARGHALRDRRTRAGRRRALA